ncbi:MAG: hypothetical protein ACI8QC_000537 [Planctomycetota bacterium]|jgi:hypothetical protein
MSCYCSSLQTAPSLSSGSKLADHHRQASHSPSGVEGTTSSAFIRQVTREPFSGPNKLDLSSPDSPNLHLGAVRAVFGLTLLLVGCSGIGTGRRTWRSPSQALGLVDQTQSAALELSGTRQRAGQETAFRWLLWPDGSWWRSCGEELEACDGERIWTQVAGAEARWLGLEETLVRRAEHSLCFGGWTGAASPWLVTGGGSAGFDLLQESGQLVARVEPAQARPERVSLPEVDFAARLGERDSGTLVPGLLEISRSGEQPSTWRVEQVSAHGKDPGEWLAWPGLSAAAEAPQAARILNAVAGPGGRLFLRPEFEGQRLGLFLLDTAASVSCIDQIVTEDLGWQRLGSTPVQGVGGVRDGTWRRSGPIDFGGWSVADWPFVELGIGDWDTIDYELVVGLLGAQFFKGHVVVLDAGRAQVELWDAGDPALEDWPWQPCVLERGAPCVYASFSPSGAGWFRLDTGSDDTLSLHRRAVITTGVMNDREAFMDLPKVLLSGIGGSAIARRGRLDWIQLGSERLSRVPTSFVVERAGPLANPNLAGTLGAGLLRHFRIAIDVDARRVAFLPAGP